MLRNSPVFVFGLLALVFSGVGCMDVHKPDNGDVAESSNPDLTGRRPSDDEFLYASEDIEASLVDDRIEEKTTQFDPELIDRRPIEGWSLNASEAVIGLDVPVVWTGEHPDRRPLYPSYAAATHPTMSYILPSINMIDGKAKQFDDGLMAAIDQAYFLGHGETLKSRLGTLRRIREKVGKGTEADDYLAAGLSLTGEGVGLTPRAKALADGFLSQLVLSQPIGVYTWNPTLSECFRVLRFFAQPIDGDAIPLEIAKVLREDEALRKDYVAAYSFDAKLTNPLVGLTPIDFLNGPPPASTKRPPVALFPPSSSRETTLFNKLFPRGLPPQADLMRELISAIRSGKVDLTPRKDGGWYEYQIYALETLLLPAKGEESAKLLMTKGYKNRLLEAFKALMTKRRETHVRGAEMGVGGGVSPVLSSVKPRLRVEPNPSHFLRTARSYAFLAAFLESTLGKPALESLHGLREAGTREPDLHAELRSMRDLFY
ncbi:hypothetical protein ACYOEI_27930, partial [Singulisphaera rosea]